MQSAAFESTFPIMGGLHLAADVPRDVRDARSAPRDIVLGNLVWIAIRLTMIAAIFTVGDGPVRRGRARR